jgi:pyruvate,orthophosphate dikinase
MTKRVYKFSATGCDGDREMKNLLGGKGANLAEMCKIGLPVPPGFTITTETCVHYYKNNNTWPTELEGQIKEAIEWLEKDTGKQFGNVENPLLVSVRSGARASMPGMMDTILNLGLNDKVVEGIAKKTGNRRFAMDSYRRFIKMFGDVVLGIKGEKGHENPFEEILHHVKKKAKKEFDNELTDKELEEIVNASKEVVLKRTGKPFPDNAWDQLKLSVNAVFASWMNERAIEYRRIYKIPEDWGTAVNVQTMVFGNMGDDCGTGVAFTRDAATGENVFYGEFLMNAQGEDVVAGIRTPNKIIELKNIMPKAYDQLMDIREKLEQHYRDMQDIEFTIENNKLYMLQCRNGKRTGLAAIRIALDLLDEGKIDEKTVMTKIEADQVTFLLRPIFNEDAKKAAKKEKRDIAKGLAAGPGAAAGRVCFFSDEVDAMKKKYGKAVLVRNETSPEDIKGMEAAEGVLTARGGMTSHAALVARQRGKTCVVGCKDLEIDYKTRIMTVNGHTVKEGDPISIDGSTGEVYLGEMPTSPSEVMEVLNGTKKAADSATYKRFSRLMEIADKFRRLDIRTNADAPGEAEIAIAFGAKGIGLCRTEHMFFGGERIWAMREMILAENEADRRKALDKLLPFQREDFAGIFKAMKGYPVTIRTLDPPLHEFLPQTEKDQKELAQRAGITLAQVHSRVEELHEANPMLGHRGCRLGITYPEITEMQARAIFEAACDVKKAGIEVKPEVMIPLVTCLPEFRNQEAVVRRVAEEVFKAKGMKVDYMVGTMIEIPRAAVTADEIAQGAEFFSFGTNDLTQTGFGISRDDYGKFIKDYMDKGVMKVDPFVSIDPGIQRLMKYAVEGGKGTRPNIKLGICGEQGGDPDSIRFCHDVGLNYVSCSPYRVPIARVAAAQAALGVGSEK